MLKNILSERVNRFLSSLQCDEIEEIRITSGAPVFATIKGNVLCSNLLMSQEDVDYTLSCVTRNSIYAVNDMMVRGFISYYGGIRVGIAGEFIYADGRIRTVKNVNSIILRIPHNVYGIADNLLKKIIYTDNKIKNTLLLGPPFSGKTTLLREISRVLSKEYKLKVVIIDEKNEISASNKGKAYLDIGYSAVCVGVSRKDGVENAIRNLSPHVIITDEVYGIEDRETIKRCLKSGVGIITSMHGEKLVGNEFEGLFENYIGLSNNPIGAVQWVK